MDQLAVQKIKVGLIGLDEVAQIIHLPILQTLSDRYEIAALCDLNYNDPNQPGTTANVKTYAVCQTLSSEVKVSA